MKLQAKEGSVALTVRVKTWSQRGLSGSQANVKLGLQTNAGDVARSRK